MMCYNCGCGIPDDDMGKGHAGMDPDGKAITDKTFKAAADSQNMDPLRAKKNALDLLQKVFNEKEKV